MRKHAHKQTHPKYRRQKPGFSSFADRIAGWMGKPWTFFIALGIVIAWLVTGPYFGFSDTWQLFINTGTTVATFLMVFLIQHTQNRDAHTIQLKLDELIRATEGAHTVLLDSEEMSERELKEARDQYKELAAKARERIRKGGRDTDAPEIDVR
jgi:low affinity Fe/Cu permease